MFPIKTKRKAYIKNTEPTLLITTLNQHVTEKPFLSDVLRRSYRLHVCNSQKQGVKIFKRDLQTGEAT